MMDAFVTRALDSDSESECQSSSTSSSSCNFKLTRKLTSDSESESGPGLLQVFKSRPGRCHWHMHWQCGCLTGRLPLASESTGSDSEPVAGSPTRSRVSLAVPLRLRVRLRLAGAFGSASGPHSKLEFELLLVVQLEAVTLQNIASSLVSGTRTSTSGSAPRLRVRGVTVLCPS